MPSMLIQRRIIVEINSCNSFERPSQKDSGPKSPVAAFPADTVSGGKDKKQLVKPDDREACGAVNVTFSEAGDGRLVGEG